MPTPLIVVIGSSNTDMVIRSPRLPSPGETILGGNFFMNAGGKGANQAVTAARLGGQVSFIAKLGRDIFGKQAFQLFKKEGIDTGSVLWDREHPSGVALINVDAKAENCIVVAPGANGQLFAKNLKKFHPKIREAAIVLAQLEIPLETVIAAADFCFAHQIKFMLNPAPARELPDSLLSRISIITPNEKEAGLLTGINVVDIDSAKRAADILHQKGIVTVIITMGASGALVFHENLFSHIPAPLVEAVDTTAAGDVFNGALAVALAEQKSMDEAVRFACHAASISVTRLGAQASVPYRAELG